MRGVIDGLLLLMVVLMICSKTHTEYVPGEIKADPDFIELYHGQKQQVQLSGVCLSVLRISLPSIFAARLNFSTLSSMKAHFRGLYLSSQGSAKLFMTNLMSSLSEEGYDSSVEPVLAYDKKKERFACTLPLMAQCRVVSSKAYNESLDVDNDWYGTTEFNARFFIGSSDASVFMCNAVTGPRRPMILFVNTLPTLHELVASIDDVSKQVTVRCSGVMSSVFSAVYLWELLIVSPSGDSHRLHDWSNVIYANDKPEPGLMSATLTAELPLSRIPVASVTFHCQIVDILGKTFTQRLLPFVLDSVMQRPHNIQVVTEKLSPIELLGALPIPPPAMVPLSTIYRLRCSFDSVAPHRVNIVWESYGFDPRSASYIGKRHSLDHQFILLNDSLYNNGHHLCRVWLKPYDPSTSLCSEAIPAPRRPVPYCASIPPDTNISSLLTDVVAFVPVGERSNAAPSRDLVVQSMTTALIVLSCVSGIFFLCLIMMIGRFHCRLRPLIRGDKKKFSSDKKKTPLLGGSANGRGVHVSVESRPSISRRFSYPGENRLANEANNNANNQAHSAHNSVSDTNHSYRLFAPPRPPVPNRLMLSTNQHGHQTWVPPGGRQPMTSVGCEADLDRTDEEGNVSLNFSQLSQAVPLLSKSDHNDSADANSTINASNNNSKDQGVVVTAAYNKRGDLSSPTFPHPANGGNSAPSETPAPVNNNNVVQPQLPSLLTRRSSSSTALNARPATAENNGDSSTGQNQQVPGLEQQSSAKSCNTIVV